MRFDENQEAVNLERNMYHSIGNRLRNIYNMGYKDGFKDGAKSVTDNIVAKLMEEQEDSERKGGDDE